MELFICHQTKVGNFVLRRTKGSNSTGSPGGGANRVCLYRLNYFQIRSPAKSALFQPLQFSSFGLVFVSSISVPTVSSVCVACRNMVAILCCARNTKSVCNQPNTQAFQKFVRISSRKHDEYFSSLGQGFLRPPFLSRRRPWGRGCEPSGVRGKRTPGY